MSHVHDKLRTALAGLEYLPSAVASWREAHGGDRALASKNATKIHLAENLISEVLASMPGGTRFEVVGLGPTLYFDSAEEFIDGMCKRGMSVTGASSDRPARRPQLRGQPTISGLCGPMYGGPGLIRYETGEVTGGKEDRP
jgi:hypothetical protein